jgi:hypothetical protein
MKRSLKKKLGLFESWCDTPAPHLQNYEIVDIISFAIKTIDGNETISEWNNPKYEEALNRTKNREEKREI